MCVKVNWEVLLRTLEQTPQVIAAWVFGSAQTGCVRPGSDLDISVLFSRPPTLDTLVTLRADLQAALRIEEIDLVTLNRASPITRFEAVSGRPIFCRDRARRAEFVSLTAREYEDAMAFLRRGMVQLKLTELGD
ncbi:MAG: nucleotidyltransferase domain-containing protein [Chloroflexota bacterium]|nr:nucleotidyltransferase domain-containing protein [Chloroflexota bacterium]